jgi:transcriptional regulator
MTDLEAARASLTPAEQAVFDGLLKPSVNPGPAARQKAAEARDAAVTAELATLPVSIGAASALRRAEKARRKADAVAEAQRKTAERKQALADAGPTDRQLEAVKLRNAGVSQRDIADLMSISQPAVSALLQRARRAGEMSESEVATDIELRHLETSRDRLTQLLERRYYKVSAGVIVREDLEDANGNPLLRPDGKPVRVKVEEVDTVLAIHDRLLKVSDAIAALKGHRAPKKATVDVNVNNTGNRGLPWASEEAMRATLLEVAEEAHRRRRGLPAPASQDDVVDVESRPVHTHGGSQ